MTLEQYLAENATNAAAFAMQLGVPSSTITRLLRGERRPGIDLVASIERATDGQVKAQDWYFTEHDARVGVAHSHPSEPEKVPA